MVSEKEIRELEKKDRIEKVRHNRRMRSIELKSQRKKANNSLSWVWEFSKRLVLICSALYVFGFFYSCVVMWKFFDFSYLGTFIEQSSDILRTCVFGYFIKAGLENVFKIWGSNRSPKSNELSEQEKHNAQIPPDGE